MSANRKQTTLQRQLETGAPLHPPARPIRAAERLVRVEFGKKPGDAKIPALGSAHRLAPHPNADAVAAAPADKPVFEKPQPLRDPPATWRVE
jgi:hypothetical protein